VSTVAPASMTLRGYKKREIKIAEVRRTGICRVPNTTSSKGYVGALMLVIRDRQRLGAQHL
jgi:hypothetical protein